MGLTHSVACRDDFNSLCVCVCVCVCCVCVLCVCVCFSIVQSVFFAHEMSRLSEIETNSMGRTENLSLIQIIF